MSCYICDKETWEMVLKAQLMCGDCIIRDNEDLKEAWLDILKANYYAVYNRYGDDILKDLLGLHPVPFTMTQWLTDMHKPSKRERYDALKEYMYQCAEGGDYHELPGYYKCQWALDEMLENYINEEFGEEG